MHSTHTPASRRSTMALSALAILALAQPVSGQAAPIRGVVFEDANRNGVRDVAERGVSGVAVSNQSDVVVTDSAGRFSISPAASRRKQPSTASSASSGVSSEAMFASVR